MEKYLDILKHSPLFKGVEDNVAAMLAVCLQKKPFMTKTPTFLWKEIPLAP